VVNDSASWDAVYADICPEGFRFLTNAWDRERMTNVLQRYGQDNVRSSSVVRDIHGDSCPGGTSVFVRKGVKPQEN